MLLLCSSDIVLARGRGGYGGYKGRSYRSFSGRSSSYRIKGVKSTSGFKSSSPRVKNVKVKGYLKKDGTYVAPHYRSAPRRGQRIKSVNFSSPKNSLAPRSSKKIKGTPYSSVAGNRTERSQAKKREFLKSRGYDVNPPGYEVDHVVPLSKGGADEPYNMQLLSEEAHKQKTKSEQSGNRGYLFRR